MSSSWEDSTSDYESTSDAPTSDLGYGMWCTSNGDTPVRVKPRQDWANYNRIIAPPPPKAPDYTPCAYCGTMLVAGQRCLTCASPSRIDDSKPTFRERQLELQHRCALANERPAAKPKPRPGLWTKLRRMFP